MAAIYLMFVGIILQSLDFSAGINCLDGWSRYKDSCYHVSHDTASWLEGMKFCELDRGRLATVEDGIEQGFLENMLKTSHHGNDFWIGASDWSVLGHWVWEPMNGQLNYTHWHHGQPDSGHHREEACSAMRHGYSYEWASLDCQNRIHYICEMTYVDSFLVKVLASIASVTGLCLSEELHTKPFIILGFLYSNSFTCLEYLTSLNKVK